jgi:putative heme transporter
MRRYIIIAIIIASALFFYYVADLESMSSAILSMSAEAVFILLLLLLINEVIKGLRWGFFLRSSNLDIRMGDALTSYLAAQAATAMPGGSMLGARLAQEHGNVKMRQAAASLVGQMFGDAFGLSVMAALAIIITTQRNIQLVIPALTVMLALIAIKIIRSPTLSAKITRFMSRYRLTQRFSLQEEDFRHHTMVLMRPRVLAGGALFSIAATILSTGILMVITNSLTERGVNAGEALYVHSFSTVARVLVPVPGGYGVSDGSLAGLLNYLGIGFARATFVALAYRTVIMLFRTVFGLLVLIARYPHLLVGQLRVPTEEPALVPALIRVQSPRVSVDTVDGVSTLGRIGPAPTAGRRDVDPETSEGGNTPEPASADEERGGAAESADPDEAAMLRAQRPDEPPAGNRD